MWARRQPQSPEFDFFQQRVGRLLLRGEQVGHVASVLLWAGTGFAFLRRVPMPTFVITWLDGTHEFCIEDTEAYEFSKDARAGRMRWEVKQLHVMAALGLPSGAETDFTISWLDEAQSKAIWDETGIPEDPPYWELGPWEEPDSDEPMSGPRH
ncbi:hypothetical protein GCM10011509_19310 [Ornithinimicrobium pekingense]|uniref:Uncharacterized protein n=2 Tax=Ornithinimicrobium pekingense TaxID=384677 RepID=A0ABQ2F816_9MICO|nr:hypothetical protein GCM10011509_19310 [Ornithinimicrobium pekingense]